MAESIYDFKLNGLRGGEIDFAALCGKVLLLVNVASRCGYTPQYSGLEKLHKDYQARGLTVIGFPCNQFGAQEPGTPEEIASFCTANYGVTFPLSEKIEVNGDHAHPLYHYLKHAAPGTLGTEGIKWNFAKFLVDRNGAVVGRYGSGTTPEELAAEIEKLL